MNSRNEGARAVFDADQRAGEKDPPTFMRKECMSAQRQRHENALSRGRLRAKPVRTGEGSPFGG